MRYSQGRKCIANLVVCHFYDLERYRRECMSNEEEDDNDDNDKNNVHCSQIFSKRNTNEQNVITSSRYEVINDNEDDLESLLIINTQPQNESCNNDGNSNSNSNIETQMNTHLQILHK